MHDCTYSTKLFLICTGLIRDETEKKETQIIEQASINPPIRIQDLVIDVVLVNKINSSSLVRAHYTDI